MTVNCSIAITFLMTDRIENDGFYAAVALFLIISP